MMSGINKMFKDEMLALYCCKLTMLLAGGFCIIIYENFVTKNIMFSKDGTQCLYYFFHWILSNV